ncbi:putative holin-like toxin [Lactobacillus sp.]
MYHTVELMLLFGNLIIGLIELVLKIINKSNH